MFGYPYAVQYRRMSLGMLKKNVEFFFAVGMPFKNSKIYVFSAVN
jgi:hypothetical protein